MASRTGRMLVMGYCLGVDIGTTYTAAAIRRDGRSEMLGLGNATVAIPSVVVRGEDGEVLIGEAAARRAPLAPQRVAREFKRRMGDPAPLVVGGAPYSADALTAIVLRWVVEQATERHGGGEPPACIAVCHPANWGPYKLDLMRQAITRADLDHDTVVLVAEPEAAAIHYATNERVDPGSVIVVYDLGGGTFDVAVLRKTTAGWEIVGDPQGVERLGGMDFDRSVLGHVAAAAAIDLDALDLDDRGTRVELAQLRQECMAAKEALSADTATTVPVALAGTQREVRLIRAELEAMVRPALSDSITAVGRALRSAGVAQGDVDAVLLVGGSSRVPLVAQLVGAELERPVAIDAHPKHCVALGAALVADQAREAAQHAASLSPAPSPSSSPPLPPPIATALPPPRPARRVVGALGAAAVLAASLVTWYQIARDDNPGGTGGTGTGDEPADTTAPNPTTVGADRFVATFNGTADQGDDLLDWLTGHHGETVELDLVFTTAAGEPTGSESPAGTDSPVLWTDCDELPEGTPPGVDHCTGSVLYIRDDPRAFSSTTSGHRLEGRFLVGRLTGPVRGLYTQSLLPAPTDQAST